MTVRASAAYLITETRLKIFDPAGGSQLFTDQQIQDHFDQYREDIWYLPMEIAPNIVNTASTGNVASVVYSSYFTGSYSYWETDCVIQGYLNGAYWKNLTPVASDYIVGKFDFEADVFNTGTVPGQIPPLFITGKVFDLFHSAADLLTYKIASMAANTFDFASGGQNFKAGTIIQTLTELRDQYRCQAKIRPFKMIRSDINLPISANSVRLLDSPDSVRGD